MSNPKLFYSIVFRLLLIGAAFIFSNPDDIVAASDTEFAVTALYRQDVPVIYDGTVTDEVTFDPQLAGDSSSIAAIADLYEGLTGIDSYNNQIVPRMAASWETSSDSLIWTFDLRNDVMWYQYDPQTDTAQAMRPVVAGDFRYAIQRLCDPRLGSFYGTVFASVIAGCDIVRWTSLDHVTDTLVYGETTQVFAPDDQTLVIHLQYPARYFLSMTTLWSLFAVYREGIEQYGEEWTAPGKVVTNGPYFLKESVRGVGKIYVRNPYYPTDLRYGGNIDIASLTVIEDATTSFYLYLDKQLDQVRLPGVEADQMFEDPVFQDQIHVEFTTQVMYVGFSYIAPFDNVHVRRAFSAVIDREAFTQQYAGGFPMIHFTPPGLQGAPPINEIGVGFDPEYARAEMTAAGYQNCQDFLPLRIVTFEGKEVWGQFLAAAAEEYLGCDGDLFTVDGLEFGLLLEAIDPANCSDNRPSMWMMWWAADYPDAHNYVHDVLACTIRNAILRPCTEVDDLIDQAARESDFSVRNELYRQIEEAFFGYEGEFPIAPVYLSIEGYLIQPWLTGPFDTQAFGFATFDMYTIDMAAKLAAQGQ